MPIPRARSRCSIDGTVLSWPLGIAVAGLYLLGAFGAVDAVRSSRTAQGAIAWAVAHLSMPFLSLPLYWLFGRARFDDYVHVLRDLDDQMSPRLQSAKAGPLRDWLVDPEDEGDVRRRGEHDPHFCSEVAAMLVGGGYTTLRVLLG